MFQSKATRHLPLVMLMIVLASTGAVMAQRPQYVYDEFDILRDDQEKLIDDFLYDVDVQTTCEIVFVIEGELEPYSTMFDMAFDYFHNVELSGVTGIGKADKDNGVLVIMTLKTGDYYIMTGYGVEAYLTDAECGRILDNILIENLDYNLEWKDFDGIRFTAEAIAEEIGYVVEVVEEPDVVVEPEPVVSEPIPMGFMINILIVTAVIALMFMPVTKEWQDDQYIWEART